MLSLILIAFWVAVTARVPGSTWVPSTIWGARPSPPGGALEMNSAGFVGRRLGVVGTTSRKTSFLFGSRHSVTPGVHVGMGRLVPGILMPPHSSASVNPSPSRPVVAVDGQVTAARAGGGNTAGAEVWTRMGMGAGARADYALMQGRFSKSGPPRRARE